MKQVSPNIQPETLADLFYPRDPDHLNNALDALLGQNPEPFFPTVPHVLIAPHSGLRFSGVAAAEAMREIRPDINRVVILSPSHRLGFDGIACPEVAHFQTPFGDLEVSSRSVRIASRLSFVEPNQDAFIGEQGIEAHLPWIKKLSPKTTIAPFVIGRANENMIQTLFTNVWGNDKTIIILSTDLAHYNSLDKILASNQDTALKIETAAAELLTRDDACGWVILKAFLSLARTFYMRAERLALADSFTVTGNAAQVVGYGSWAFHEANRWKMPSTVQSDLYAAIARAIWAKLNKEEAAPAQSTSKNLILSSHWPCFVKLNLRDEQRIAGALNPRLRVIDQCVESALEAAFEYRDANPITKDEFEELTCEIEVVSMISEMPYKNRKDLERKLEDAKPGVILSHSTSRASFLPERWEDYRTAKKFLGELVQRAGHPEGFWDDAIGIKTYATERLDRVRLADFLHNSSGA